VAQLNHSRTTQITTQEYWSFYEALVFSDHDWTAQSEPLEIFDTTRTSVCVGILNLLAVVLTALIALTAELFE